MRKKLSSQFIGNFWITFILTIFATTFAFILISLASSVIASRLAKNRYSASSIINEDYTQIDASEVVASGGGIQIIDKNYHVVYSVGIDTINKQELSIQEFTTFLTESKSKAYHYDILYEPNGEFWLIVTFPTSIRFDFALVYNKEASPNEFNRSLLVIVIVGIIYLIILAFISLMFAQITSSKITIPLKKLTEGTMLLREGDYSARVELRLKNEFKELQDTFNDMADRIGQEISLRKQSEENRRRLILDISHDLKNPLTSIQGYAEVLCQKSDMPELKVIYHNSKRANFMLSELFALSQIDSPDFTLKVEKTELCEVLRVIFGEMIPQLESANFKCDFAIPETSIYVMLNEGQFRRVIHNLIDNAIRYNPSETKLVIKVIDTDDKVMIKVSDDGVGIPQEIVQDLFNPFIHKSINNQTESYGSGLGLSIAQKIMRAHQGNLHLDVENPKGTTFVITLPKI